VADVGTGSPQRRDDIPHRRAGLSSFCQASGAVLALATLTCARLGVVSAQQAIAMGLPAAVLILGDLIVASVPDPSTGSRIGFQAGLRAGAIVNRWRFLVRPRGKGAAMTTGRTFDRQTRDEI